MFQWTHDLATIIVNWIGLNPEISWGASLHFFIYDTIKILILLFIMIFIVSYIRSYFPPEKTKKILEKFPGITGNIMASLLGVVTPFCSCSSVPIFIGFIEAGVPLGVTFSFLITSPIVNEAAFAMLLASFGWQVATIYVISGVVIGVIGGIVIGKLKMEDQVEEYVYKVQMGETKIGRKSQKERFSFAYENVKDIIKRVWLFVIIGIGIGGLIHGKIPAEFITTYLGDNPFTVPLATIIGVPLYSNALGTIPIAEALIGKGLGLGTALAFMMSTTALSLPAGILMKKVIKTKLIVTFFGVTTLAIIFTGYIFNWIL
ncbi:MAG: permease [Thermotogota bacterium]